MSVGGPELLHCAEGGDRLHEAGIVFWIELSCRSHKVGEDVSEFERMVVGCGRNVLLNENGHTPIHSAKNEQRRYELTTNCSSSGRFLLTLDDSPASSEEDTDTISAY